MVKVIGITSFQGKNYILFLLVAAFIYRGEDEKTIYIYPI